MRFTYTISTGLLVFLIILAYLSLLAMPTVFINYHIFLYILIAFITILFFSTIALIISNKKIRSIIYNHYKIKTANDLWRTEDFNNMQSQILINYLKRKKLYTPEKLKLLVELLNKEVERSKSPSLLAQGAFLALFTPIWLQYIIGIFKLIDNWSFNYISLFVLVSTIPIIFITICIGTFKRLIHFFQGFFMIEINIKKKFILHIENIQLRFNEEERNEINVSLKRSKRIGIIIK